MNKQMIMSNKSWANLVKECVSGVCFVESYFGYPSIPNKKCHDSQYFYLLDKVVLDFGELAGIEVSADADLRNLEKTRSIAMIFFSIDVFRCFATILTIR